MPEQLMRVCLECHWQARTRLLVCHCGSPLVCRAQGLKVCRMCRVQFDAGPNARNTQRCPECVAKQPRVQNLRRTCTKCGYVYKGLLTVCPCGGKMLSASERDRTYPKCGCSFRVWVSQVYCDACVPADTLKKRAERAALAEIESESILEAKPPEIPCATCKHGASSTIADSGWLCRIERAGACRPHSVALYYEKETTDNV